MGRIKTTFRQRLTNELVQKHGDQFTENFDKNKEIVANFVDSSSKKNRNMIAGYVTSVVKNRETLE